MTATRFLIAMAATAMLFAPPSRSRAGSIANYSFSDSKSGLAGTADFSLSGTTLTVVVTNTAKAATTDNGDTLGGIFLNLTNTTTFAPSTLALTAGSHVLVNGSTSMPGKHNTTVPVSQDITGQWFEASDTKDHLHYNTLLSSVGYNSGSKNYFDGAKGDTGVNYGLISGSAQGNGNGFYGKEWISDSVTMTLTVASTFTLANLGRTIIFQYGSNASQDLSFVGKLVTVPEPSSFAMAGTAGMAVLAVARRRRSKARTQGGADPA
jgi:hypothetical protein